MTLSTLTKSLTYSELRILHMKVILVLIIGVLLWQSENARSFTADVLDKGSEMIRPEEKPKTIGETIDSFLK